MTEPCPCDHRQSSVRTIYITAGFGALVALAIAVGAFSSEGEALRSAFTLCNVHAYTLYGELGTAGSAPAIAVEGSEGGAAGTPYSVSDDIVAGIEASDEDPSVKALLLEVDSVGGLPIAGEEVANALRAAQKPTAVLIRSAGLSAAYWAATGADTIFASKNSDVGSIGVVLAYVDRAQQNEDEGLTYNSVTSGAYKDLGSPEKPLSDEERELIQRDVDIIKSNFIRAVSENRGLTYDDVERLADGSSLLGEMALRAGLIDEIGDFNAVKRHLQTLIGEDVEVCWNP